MVKIRFRLWPQKTKTRVNAFYVFLAVTEKGNYLPSVELNQPEACFSDPPSEKQLRRAQKRLVFWSAENKILSDLWVQFPVAALNAETPSGVFCVLGGYRA